MKTINAIVKVLTALAAVAGAVYIIATYGDKIVDWAKEMLAKAPQAPAPVPDSAPAAQATAAAAAPVEETAAEESAEAAPAEEAPEAPVVVDENSPVADESDFEG